jgi:hypothetical protein
VLASLYNCTIPSSCFNDVVTRSRDVQAITITCSRFTRDISGTSTDCWCMLTSSPVQSNTIRPTHHSTMSAAPTSKIKGSKGHAGGTGKKGKKFIEDKVGLCRCLARRRLRSRLDPTFPVCSTQLGRLSTVTEQETPTNRCGTVRGGSKTGDDVEFQRRGQEKGRGEETSAEIGVGAWSA